MLKYLILQFNSKVDQQKNRLLTADVISKAKELADQQDFEKARELVTKASKIIQESISGGEPFCKVTPRLNPKPTL